MTPSRRRRGSFRKGLHSLPSKHSRMTPLSSTPPTGQAEAPCRRRRTTPTARPGMCGGNAVRLHFTFGDDGRLRETPERPPPSLHCLHAHTHTIRTNPTHSAPHPHAQYGPARGGRLLSRLVTPDHSHHSLVRRSSPLHVMSCMVCLCLCCLVVPLNQKTHPPSLPLHNLQE